LEYRRIGLFGEAEALHLNSKKEKQELDSSFRWNDELKSKGAGFRLSPE